MYFSFLSSLFDSFVHYYSVFHSFLNFFLLFLPPLSVSLFSFSASLFCPFFILCFLFSFHLFIFFLFIILYFLSVLLSLHFFLFLIHPSFPISCFLSLLSLLPYMYWFLPSSVLVSFLSFLICWKHTKLSCVRQPFELLSVLNTLYYILTVFDFFSQLVISLSDESLVDGWKRLILFFMSLTEACNVLQTLSWFFLQQSVDRWLSRKGQQRYLQQSLDISGYICIYLAAGSSWAQVGVYPERSASSLHAKRKILTSTQEIISLISFFIGGLDLPTW